VWDDSRQSKLIESITLGLPIPIIFLAENTDGRLEIVDGSQRIRTLAAFMRDELVLEELDKLTELNGLKYSDLLVSRRNKIANTPIRMIVLSESSTEEVRNDLFERIIPNPLLIIELFSSCLLPPASCLAFTIRGLPKRI
jgi:hypothetical protein